MNIAFDAVALLGAMSKNRGIGNYALDQFRTLIRSDRQNRYFFFNGVEPTTLFEKEKQEGLLQEEYFQFYNNGHFLDCPGLVDVFGETVKKYIRDNQIDVFYITSPFEIQQPRYQKEWFEGVKVVMTVYDIIPYVMKNHYFPRKSDMSWYMECIDMLRWADKLLVISQSVKDDMVSYLHFPEAQIDVIWGAVGRHFRKIEVTEKEKSQLFEKFKIDRPFVMCTGGDDERKNLAGLIRAFGKLPKEITQKHQLVIVCKLQPASVERYTELAKQLHISDSVVLTNFVSNEELLQLYNLAELVAFPSVYEGFGLPVVEAWACGTPVLTSNNSSLGQIAGDAAILVDPNAEKDITRGLLYALTECDLQDLTARGEQRLEKHFRWEVVAREMVKIFASLEMPVKGQERIRPRIAFFTPLPPVQSGISDYSEDIINALSPFCDIDVFLDDGYETTSVFPENVCVYSHSQYKKKRKRYQNTLFQMGNSEYHIYMWPYIKKYRGIVVLHDYNMHGVVQFEALYRRKNDLKLYKKLLVEDYRVETVDAYIADMEKGKGMNLSDYELNGFICNYADKIIVHSQEAQEKLLQRDIARNVRVIRSYAKIETLPDVPEAKKSLGIPDDRFVFAAFGHIHETKRAIPIVRAFAKLAEQRPEAQLIFVGKLDDSIADRFRETCSELGVEDRVSVTGYTDLDKFKQYIDATDVCLNLRWPYNGETSGSLMRILAKGKVVVVNGIGSFGEIPDAACVKLPSAEKMSALQEVDTLYAEMLHLVADAGYRETLQQEARAYAEETLAIEKIAEQYMDFMNGPVYTALTETLLDNLRQVIQAQRIPDAQIRNLAHTLQYLKT